MKKERAGDLYALACSLACGLGNIPAKSALDRISPEIFNFYLFLFGWIFSSLPLFAPRGRREIASVSPKTLGLIFFLSISFSLALSLNMAALKSMEPATVSFLSRFEVVLTVILAFFVLKEKLSLIEILGGAIALGGILVLKYKTNIVISRGATMMVFSALFYATSEIIIKKNIARISTVGFLFFRNLFLIPILYAAILIKGQRPMLPDSKTIFLISLAALLLPVIGRATYQLALKRIDISRAALISQATPICTAIFAFLILNSLPSPIEWLGGGLIIGGVLIVQISEKRFGKSRADFKE
jgi:drug/metabolite transporter (DMT)-like permease